MTKPIGYYTSYTPGDAGLIADMQDNWGPQFQKLNNSERLWMIATLAQQILDDEPTQYISSSIWASTQEAGHRLSVGDRLGLIEALVNQVKYSTRL